MTNYKSIKYNISGADLTGIPTSAITSGTFADARISESSVTAHVTATDLQPIKSDISALALREATNEASAAFNLPNQFIETFTDDTNLGTQTTGDRVTGFWATVYSSYGADTLWDWANDDVLMTTTGWVTNYTGVTVANSSGGGYGDDIGVGDSTTAAAVGQTDLQGTALWKTVVTADRVFITPTVYLSVEFGYNEANFVWNEMGLRDSQGTPVLWARQIDSSPLTKTSSKRAIVEWQLSM